MKKNVFGKISVGLIVALSFIAYSLHSNRDDAHAVVKPNQPNTNKATSTTPATEIPGGDTGASSPTTAQTSHAAYKDGSYTGSSADAFYGYIQVKVTIASGRITDVVFLQYPNDRDTSRLINAQAMPYLKQQAIQAQNASVDGVSGATDTSQAFVQSLSSALNQAQKA